MEATPVEAIVKKLLDAANWVLDKLTNLVERFNRR